MLKTTEKLIEAGLANKVFNNTDFKELFMGTAASRYGLLNKALDKGEIIQLKRGCYILNQKYNNQKLSKYYIASQIVPHSYVSLESALSFHGWIPEKVTTISSVIYKGRSRSFITEFGEFEYHTMPVQPYEFLTGVQRESVGGRPFLMASGIRALLDLVYEKGYEWSGLDFIQESLRIEIDNLKVINRTDYNDISNVYRSKRVLKFLQNMTKELRIDE
jgi:predicted transcriptional regulator of viral defense system